MEVSSQLHAPAALPPRKETLVMNELCPLDRRLGGPQSRSGRGDEEKKLEVLDKKPHIPQIRVILRSENMDSLNETKYVRLC
jgi:hypothetical protein